MSFSSSSSGSTVIPTSILTVGKWMLWINIVVHLMLILCSCLRLNLNYSGCCEWFLSQTCSNNGCYCDENCYIFNDCCSDIANINCHHASSLSSTVSHILTDTLGKTNFTFDIYKHVWKTMYISNNVHSNQLQ